MSGYYLYYGGKDHRLKEPAAVMLKMEVAKALKSGEPQLVTVRLANGSDLALLVSPSIPIAVEVQTEQSSKPQAAFL